MKLYTQPEIKISCFSTADNILTASGGNVNTGSYAEEQLANYMFSNGNGVSGVKAMQVQDVMNFN